MKIIQCFTRNGKTVGCKEEEEKEGLVVNQTFYCIQLSSFSNELLLLPYNSFNAGGADYKARDVFSFLFIPLGHLTFSSITTWKIRKL